MYPFHLASREREVEKAGERREKKHTRGEEEKRAGEQEKRGRERRKRQKRFVFVVFVEFVVI